MNRIGRKIYFDLNTGNIILITSEMVGSVKETTVDEDFMTYGELAIRNRETVGVVKLAYGQYSQDFNECNGYRINLETGQLEFSYKDPNNPESEIEEYQKPLSEQIKELEERQNIAENAILALMDAQIQLN